MATPTVKEALREGIERSRGVLAEPDERYLEVATDFHGVVSGASGNSVLDLLARSLKDIYVARVRSIVYAARRAREAPATITRSWLTPSSPGDGDRAEALMRDHMEEYVAIMEERFAGFMDEKIDWF